MGALTLPRLVAGLAVCAAVACSLTYDWDPNGQPCRQEGTGFACDEGYSCYQQPNVATTECVRDGSRRRGEGCSLDAMCGEGNLCVGGACREACGRSYLSSLACRGDEFCKPYPGKTTGFCTKSECLGDTCPIGRICAQLKDGAGACLIECTPHFTDQSYSDNCGSTTGQNYCQAVGRGTQRRLVCLDTTPTGQTVAQPCNVIDQPCAGGQSYLDTGGQTRKFGLTCVNASCVELCDATAPSPGTNASDCGASTAIGASYCCAQTGALDSGGVPIQWGICITFGGTGTCDPQSY